MSEDRESEKEKPAKQNDRVQSYIHNTTTNTHTNTQKSDDQINIMIILHTLCVRV